MNIKVTSRDRIIDGLSSYTNLEQNKAETLIGFCRRLLRRVRNNLSIVEIAEICLLSRMTILRAYKQYGITAVPRNEWPVKFARVRARAAKKTTSKSKSIRQLYGLRKYNYDQVRKLMIELKSVKQTALELNAPKVSIQSIITRQRRINPDWLTYRCEYCFKTFIPKVTHQIYCNKQCANERKTYLSRIDRCGLNLKHRGDIIVCEKCGSEIKKIETPTDYKIKYCQMCRYIIRRQARRDWRRKQCGTVRDYGMEIPCEICGDNFKIKTVGDMQRKYCSNKCYKDALKILRKIR